METKWIFLRGLTRGSVHWGDFCDHFKKIYPDAIVEYLEIPGNGFLSNEKTPINPLLLIDYLRKHSNIVNSKTPYNLCGISLGGMVALKWFEIFPENIKSVSIINSSLSQMSPFYHRLMPTSYFSLLKILFANSFYLKEKRILELTSNKFSENHRYLDFFSDFSMKNQVTFLNILRQLILATSIRIDNVSGIKLNVLTSENDRLVKSICSKKIATQLDGNLYIHPSAGHDLPLDDPEWVIKNL